MIPTFLAAVLLAAPIASAQAGAPARPASPAPATPGTPSRSPSPAPSASPSAPSPSPAAQPPPKLSPAELHAQAYAFMRDEKFDKATPLLNRAYNETPPPQRARALILNRALLDLVQKANPMRGIKDVHQYLARHHAPDEQASNLLASLLELAAENRRWRDGPLYAEALREFARREAVLERHRPGFKRWGHRWITQAEFDAITDKDRELERQIAEQEQYVGRLAASQVTLNDQYNVAARKAYAFANHRHVRRYNDPVRLNPAPCAACQAMYEAQRSVNDINAELQTLNAQVQREQRELAHLKTRQVKPQWPRRYPPIDPDAPPPPPPQHPAVAALAATQPATAPSAATEAAGGSPPVLPPTPPPSQQPTTPASPFEPTTQPSQSSEPIW